MLNLRDLGLHGLLCDDMGLGKTLQALCAVKKGARTLVVAPTSVLHNWVDETQKFRPSLRVCVYHGPGRVLDEQADLLLTTYPPAHMEAEAAERQAHLPTHPSGCCAAHR